MISRAVSVALFGLMLVFATSVRAEPSVDLKPKVAFPDNSIGVQLGGGGIAGIVFHTDINDKLSLGVGAMYRPTMVQIEGGIDDGDTKTYGGVMVPLECTFWM